MVTFFVHPDFQGGGIGSHLLQALASEAVKREITSLKVESSLTGKSFYEHRGFKDTGKTKEGTAGTQILLVRTLTG